MEKDSTLSPNRLVLKKKKKKVSYKTKRKSSFMGVSLIIPFERVMSHVPRP